MHFYECSLDILKDSLVERSPTVGLLTCLLDIVTYCCCIKFQKSLNTHVDVHINIYVCKYIM